MKSGRLKDVANEKVYVFDTNVVLYDPQALFKFKEHEIVIPITVVEEVDKFKKDMSEIGRNARHFSRELDELITEKTDLAKGVELKSGGKLRVILGSKGIDARLPTHLVATKHADTMILAIALEVQSQASDKTVILLTKDTNLRIRAHALGLMAQDYDPEVVSIDELYSGWRDISLSLDRIDELMKNREGPLNGLECFPNEHFLIRAKEGSNQSVLARAMTQDGKMRAISDYKRPVWGISPKNREQTFAMDVLMDDSVRLVTLVGKAGTGKTLLAIAAGLYKVTEEQVYHRVLVSRPVFPLGRDIGYLPGDIEEKLAPWMQPIFDNVELLLNLSSAGRDRRKTTSQQYRHKELIDLGMLSIEPLTYIRGRSIPHQFMIVDEAQNLTPHEVKTIITRAGENTKVVLTGDPYQIDNPYLDSSNNGLTYVVEKFKREPMAGHVTLTRGERSPLAELATNLL